MFCGLRQSTSHRLCVQNCRVSSCNQYFEHPVLHHGVLILEQQYVCHATLSGAFLFSLEPKFSDASHFPRTYQV